jgi:hypothetical protein
MLPVSVSRLLLSATIAVTSLSGFAVAQTATESKVLSQAILPKETYLFLSVPSVQVMKQSFADSSAGRLWNDPALDEFKADVHAAFADDLSEGFANVQEALGLSVEELMAIPTGEISMAVAKAPPNKMGLIVFFDYGEHESEVAGLLEKASAALNNVPELEAAPVEHGGTELTMYNVKHEVAKQTPLAKEFGWFLKDQRLVVSNSSALLKLTIDNWDGTSEKNLNANEVFSYIMGKCETTPGASMVTSYADPVGLFTQLVQTGSLGEAGLGAGMAIGFFPTLGLNQLKGMGSVGELGDGEFEGVSRAFIYCEQPPQAAMQIFQLAPVDATPPAWVKNSASAWLATNWKVGEAYAAIESMFDVFQGAGAFAGLIDKAAEDGPQIHIKNDVIDQLDGNMQMVMAPPGRDADAASDDILFAIGLRDGDKFSEVLTKVAALPGFPGESRKLAGATVYEMTVPGDNQKFAVTVANNQLLIGIGGMQLEQAVRNDSDLRPLSESEDFKAVAEHFADGALAVTFARPAEQYRGLYDMLRNGEAADSFPGMDELFEKIDFSKLPEYDVIAKYLAPGGGYWVGDENGVMMQSYSLKVE